MFNFKATSDVQKKILEEIERLKHTWIDYGQQDARLGVEIDNNRRLIQKYRATGNEAKATELEKKNKELREKRQELMKKANELIDKMSELIKQVQALAVKDPLLQKTCLQSYRDCLKVHESSQNFMKPPLKAR